MALIPLGAFGSFSIHRQWLAHIPLPAHMPLAAHARSRHAALLRCELVYFLDQLIIISSNSVHCLWATDYNPIPHQIWSNKLEIHQELDSLSSQHSRTWTFHRLGQRVCSIATVDPSLRLRTFFATHISY